MKEIFLPPDHPSIVATLNNTSTVISFKRETVKTLELCLKALSMRERVLPINHPDVALSLSSVGLRYEVMGENRHALEHFEKAFEIRTLFLTDDDAMRKRVEKHILRIKRKLV